MRRIFIAVLFALIIPAAGCAGCWAQSGPPLIGEEEYKVFAAVLAPPEQVKPYIMYKNPARLAPDHRWQRPLDGIYSLQLVIEEETASGSTLVEPAEGPDVFLIRDFNARNKELPGKILQEKLAACLPQGQELHIVSRKELQALYAENSGGGKKFHEKYPAAKGVITLSRVGFDEKQGRAVVFVCRQSRNLMGAGYNVFLKKSPGGNWTVTSSQRTYKF